MRQVVLGAVIAFAVTVAVFSFLSPKSSDPAPPPAPPPSSDGGNTLGVPKAEVRFLKPNLSLRKIDRLGIVNEDAGLPDSAAP